MRNFQLLVGIVSGFDQSLLYAKDRASLDGPSRVTLTIGLEMCLCGDEKWNRARNFAENLKVDWLFENTCSEYDIQDRFTDVWIEQFAEDHGKFCFLRS